MKKLLLATILVILLASCVPEALSLSADKTASPIASVAQQASAPVATPRNSSTPVPSPHCAYTSLHEGECVSETFYTGDLQDFFMLSSEELCALIGCGYEKTGRDIVYSRFGVSFEYDFNMDDGSILFYDPSEEEPEMVLQRIALYSFDFHGLKPSSDFAAVKNTLGDSEPLIIHEENRFYYTLRYRIGGLQFDFFSPDEDGAGGITLAATNSSAPQVFYLSCGSGDPVSKTLTTDDIKSFLELSPDGLDSIIGNGWSGFDEDTGIYSIYFDYLGVGFSYCLQEDEKGAYPVNPLNCVWIEDFDFKGLNQSSNFEDIIQVLGEKEINETEVFDESSFNLQYRIDGMLFKFSSSDEQASDGVYLTIMPG